MAWLIGQYRGFRIWWATMRGHPINVRWFGADNTGRKDSSQAFQRAIDHAAKQLR